MTDERRDWSFQACLQFTYGFACSQLIYVVSRIDWKAEDVLATIAFFVAYALLNALVTTLICSGMLSLLVFPLEYFLIRRFNRVMVGIFFVAGVLISNILINTVLSQA